MLLLLNSLASLLVLLGFTEKTKEFIQPEFTHFDLSLAEVGYFALAHVNLSATVLVPLSCYHGMMMA
jgi:hypothetical protein